MDADAPYEQIKAYAFEQRAEEAESLAREMLLDWPDSDQLKERLGEALLLQGRWAEAWPLLEHRRGRLQMCAQPLARPEWRGEPLNGRSILVWGEQGLGDEVQMARFLPALRERGAGRITVGCLQPMHRAFRLLGADETVDRVGQLIRIPTPDTWIALGSLPCRLGITPETLSGAPYFSAWRMGGGGIGLVERGNPKHPNDAQRSLPAGMLQAAVPAGRTLDPRGDVLESLAQLARLDLLITVDTSWAHLAGALGLPVWMLLPCHGLDPRWMRQRSDTPWYRSARLFRQPNPGDWGGVIGAVCNALAYREGNS